MRSENMSKSLLTATISPKFCSPYRKSRSLNTMVTADFGSEIELTLFLRMRTKEIVKTAKMYSDTQAISLLQEIGITNANNEVRFLTSGPSYKKSKVSRKCVISFS